MGTVLSTIVGSRHVSDVTARKGGPTVYRGGADAASSFTVSGLIAYEGFARFISSGAPALPTKALGGTRVYSDTSNRVVDFGMHTEFAVGSHHAPAITMDYGLLSFKAAEKLSFAEHAAKTEKTPIIADRHLNLAVMLFGQYVAAGFDAPHGAAGIDITHLESTSRQITLAPHHV
jgi:hypothetical protein